MKKVTVSFTFHVEGIPAQDVPALLAAALMAGKDHASVAGAQMLHSAAMGARDADLTVHGGAH